MVFEHPHLKPIVAEFAVILAIFLLSCLPLAAQQADSQDETALLEALAQADPATAGRVERQIKALWGKSGSASMDLLLKRGRDALEVDDSRAAIEHLTALTDHAPDFAEGWHTRARAFFKAGLYGPALADLEQTLRLNPNHYDAILGVGAILETFEDPDRAYQAYLRAQAIHPHHEEIGKALEQLKPMIEGKAL